MGQRSENFPCSTAWSTSWSSPQPVTTLWLNSRIDRHDSRNVSSEGSGHAHEHSVFSPYTHEFESSPSRSLHRPCFPPPLLPGSSFQDLAAGCATGGLKFRPPAFLGLFCLLQREHFATTQPGFKKPRWAQEFLALHARISNLHQHTRTTVPALNRRTHPSQAHHAWQHAVNTAL